MKKGEHDRFPFSSLFPHTPLSHLNPTTIYIPYRYIIYINRGFKGERLHFCYNTCYNKVYKSLIFSRAIFDFGFVITKFCAKNSL